MESKVRNALNLLENAGYSIKKRNVVVDENIVEIVKTQYER